MPISGFTAGATVNPARFVKQDPSADCQVLQAGAGDFPFGISTPSQNSAPIPGASSAAASAGQGVAVFTGSGTETLLSVSGTVAAGDKLKPISGGQGVTTTNSGDLYGALALTAGVNQSTIRVMIVGPGVKV